MVNEEHEGTVSTESFPMYPFSIPEYILLKTPTHENILHLTVF